MSSHIPLPRDKHNKNKLYITSSHLLSAKKEHAKCIETHPFNHQCTIIVPTRPNPANTLSDLTPGHYYKGKLRLLQFLDPLFISTYVKSGSFVALSHENAIDSNDVFAIDGKGNLILSLGKDSYEAAGLVGTEAKFPLEQKSRHIVSCNLAQDCMQPGRKLYERFKRCFDTVLTEEIEFIIAHFNSSTGASNDIEIKGMVKCINDITIQKFEGAHVPEFSEILETSTHNPSDSWIEQAQELFDWIGLASMRSQRLLNIQTDPFINTYMVPEPNKKTDISIVTITGLLAPGVILNLVSQLSQGLDSFFLAVWGFDDAPVSWASCEHAYLVGGENMYAQAYDQKLKQCLTFQACGAWDSFS